MSLGRLRQISAILGRRRVNEIKRQEQLVAWQTRTLAQFVAATVESVKGENPLLDEAGKVGNEILDDGSGGDKTEVKQENRAGSFERLTSGFVPR